VDAGALWFTELTGLPGDRTPVTTRSNPDEAWAEVARRIGEAAREIAERRD
jgi:RecG-like helicase